MRRIYIVSYILFWCLTPGHNVLYCQNETLESDRIIRAMDSIVKQENYTRIPNKDFDEILDSKVSTKINEKFTYWFTVIGIFLTAIAGLSAYAFNNKVKALVVEQVKSQSEKEFETIKNYIQQSKKYILGSELKTIRDKININPASEANMIEAKNLLEQIKDFKNPELLSEIVDVLVIAYYKNRNAAEIEKLIKNNESSCELKETTYMNAAILYADLYQLDGSSWYKQNCLKYCNISIKKVAHYGEPQGITLLIHAIDYVNNPNEEIKSAALKNARNLIAEILTGSDFLTAYYTVDRLNRDKKNPAYKGYILELEKAIPNEFTKLYERASAYASRSNNPAI